MPVDSFEDAVHTLSVSGLPNRLNIPDARGSGAYLRVTRHPDQQKVVLSHWRDSVCVASTPVDISDVPSDRCAAEALGDAVVMSGSSSVSRPHETIGLVQVEDLFRPGLAKIVDLHMMPGQQSTPMRHDTGQ